MKQIVAWLFFKWRGLKVRLKKALLCKEEGLVLAHLDGYKMLVLKDDRGLSLDLLADGVREKGAVPVFDSLLQPGMTVLDIGANIGYYALREAHLVGERGKVFAVEPFRESYDLLVRNLSFNHLSNVQAFNVAILDHEGEIDFYIHEERNLNSITPSATGSSVGRIKVQAIPLDSFVATHQVPNVIRMDVEGAEAKILKGATDTLSDPGLQSMFIEFHPHIMQEEESREVIESLIGASFRSLALIPSISNYEEALCRLGLSSAGTVTHKSLQDILNDSKLISGQKGAYYLFVAKEGMQQ